MKRFISIAAVILIALGVFSACAKKEPVNPTNSRGEVTYPQSSNVLYDRNGDCYSEKSEVKYFDRDGNVYYFVMDSETYLPSFVNKETGDKLDGFFCYISEDGYLVTDYDNRIKLDEGSTYSYHDDNGNAYYDISRVEWDENGKLITTKIKD